MASTRVLFLFYKPVSGWMIHRRINVIKRTYLVFGLLLLPCILKADHLPDREMAKGKSDTVLSGVNVYVSTVAAVEKRLGKPARIEDLPERDNVAGGRNYEWRRPGVRLVLGTWSDKGRHSIASSVEVWGAKPDGIIGTTGEGDCGSAQIWRASAGFTAPGSGG